MAAVVLTSCRVDSQRESDGVWQDSLIIPGVSFKVRGITFPQYTIARDILQQRLRRKSGSKPIPEKDWVEGHGALFAEHLLLDWKGFADDDKNPLPYSKEVAHDILTNAEYRLVINAVEAAAGQVSQAEIDFVEVARKNSEVPSVTS